MSNVSLKKMPWILALTGVACLQAFAPVAEAKVARPPQYVVLAFDGSKSLPMWAETRQYAKDMTAKGKPLKFTYFINAAYYLNNAAKNAYDAPEAGRGKSAIGFGGTLDDVISRLGNTNAAKAEQNEIANHATGHYDGTKWTAQDWKSEFTQFYDLIFNLFKYNNVDQATADDLKKKWTFTTEDIIGFRAPQLGHNDNMYDQLPKFGLKYDTSLTAPPERWPRMNAQGLWSFPLAEIQIAGTGRKTLSMDYNFYYAQSKGLPNAVRATEFKNQMYYSYVDYFFNNYNGNRAPVNIGHHFSKWNGGAYWSAMKQFAELVCGMPEVKCVTYEELMNYMNSDQATKALVAAYEKGDFDHTAAERPRRGRSMIMPPVMKGIDENMLMIGDPAEAHDEIE